LFARYWLHNGFLSIDSTKMSKSLGNVLLVHNMIKSTPGEVIRLALLSAHYRQPLDWSDVLVNAARRMLDRLYGALRGVEITPADRAGAIPAEAVLNALEDDLNTPRALSEIFNLVRRLNKATDPPQRSALAATLLASCALIGIAQGDTEIWFGGDTQGKLSAEAIEALIEKRSLARTDKNFALADAIREQLTASGITIEDSATGTRWRRS